MNTKVVFRLGKNIKKYRMSKKLTQEKLAEKVHVHETYIGKIEIGKSCPSIKCLYKISRALKITLPDLFDFDR